MHWLSSVRLPATTGLWRIGVDGEQRIAAVHHLPPGSTAAGACWGGDWLSPMGVDLQINGGLGLAFPELGPGDLPRLLELLELFDLFDVEMIGRFGTPPAPMDPNVRDRIEQLPRARELAAQSAMPELSELRRRFDSRLSDEEFLLRATMPAEQVDAMVAAGPCRQNYSAVASPVERLLREQEVAGSNPVAPTCTT